jgi:hypothetical protein
VATVTDPQSFLSRRPTLWHWNELEVDDEQTPFVFGLTHWYFQGIKQKTCLSPTTKCESCHCPGLHLRHCLKYFAHTSLYKKCIVNCWPFTGTWSEQAVLSLVLLFTDHHSKWTWTITILLPHWNALHSMCSHLIITNYRNVFSVVHSHTVQCITQPN